MHLRLAILVPALALAACGQSVPPAIPAEVAQLRVLAGTLRTALETYVSRSTAVRGSTDCRAERTAYEVRAGPAIQGMLSVAPRLDPWMRARGSTEHADLACGVASLLAEFERHTDIACTAVDMDANRAEAAAHLLAMNRWLGLLAARAEEAALPAGEEDARSGPRCVRFGDGARMYMP
jgi:hypothetical protein